jgi:murein DD-endopeptidase MepM/ murein hydrolase activator NlpD
MANYRNHTPERATPDPNGGCPSGFIFIPMAVIAMSIVLVLTLSRIGTTSSVASMPTSISHDPLLFVSPYDDFTLTQGPHGFSYGHMAIDIAAGKGATIYAPINGKVSDLFVDGLGNPTLVIENETYRVTLMHGVYTVRSGDQVTAGKPIGTESNLGNTTDMQGRSCRNRDCGYHTHLNVFDKRINSNINPLDLLEP